MQQLVLPKPQIEQPKKYIEPQPSEYNSQDHIEEHVLAKYVRRNHSPKKIIRYKSVGFMKRSKLKDITFFITAFEPRIVKDALDNKD